MRSLTAAVPRIRVVAALAAAGVALAASSASASAGAPGAGGPGAGTARPRVVYAALGDSYSSGVGTPDPDPAVPACYRTPHAWPNLVGRALRWRTVNLACSGAQTKDIVAPFGGQPAQSDLLAALRPRPLVVTITIGGNDVGFGPVIGACFSPAVPDCTPIVAQGEAAILTVLPGRLASTFRAVEAADPRARLVVVGYPRLFPTSASAVRNCPTLSDAERQALNHAGALLDAVIAMEARRAGATYVDVSDSLSGHELCTADPWLVPLTPSALGAAHPTIQGQRAIAAVVTHALADLRLTPSRPRTVATTG
jgi:lysophospholipase L1-like esterase